MVVVNQKRNFGGRKLGIFLKLPKARNKREKKKSQVNTLCYRFERSQLEEREFLKTRLTVPFIIYRSIKVKKKPEFGKNKKK